MGAGFPAVASAPDGADAHVRRESVAGGESSQNHQLCPRPDSRRALIIRFCPLAHAAPEIRTTVHAPSPRAR